MFLIILLAMGMFGFTFWLARQTLARDAGPKEMTCVRSPPLWAKTHHLLCDAAPGRLVATAIREGAEGFLSTQYSTITRYVIVMAGMLFCLYLTRPPPHPTISTFTMACLMSSTFCTGAFMSGLAGYIGMWISVRANVRTAAAATRSYQESIDTALRGGAVCGLLVVGLCVFGLTTLFMLFRSMFPDTPSAFTPNLLVGFGFGASLVALFAQVGGGIYTKAADVGADLVGKVEVGIPEDDPRNPAVIADLVGDNVGDCAGRGADLFESISAEIIGAMLLGGSLATSLRLPEDTTARFMMFPLLIHSVDMVVSSIGVLSIRVKKSGNVAPFRLDQDAPLPSARACSPCYMRSPPLLTRACSPCYMRLQPLRHAVAGRARRQDIVILRPRGRGGGEAA